jgi:predicted phage terminase large subunit-like protein
VSNLRRQAEILRELAERDALTSLAWFVRLLWPIVEPARLEWSWHMQAVCDALQEVAEGRVTRLVINIPPGFSKSLLTSVFYPAWQWLRKPSARNLFLSHDADLATRDSRRMRILILSPEYRRLLARAGQDWTLSADQNQKVNFENTARGFRYCGSLTSGITGKRGDGIVIDDPHDAKDVTTGSPDQVRARLDEVKIIFSQTLQTRMNDPRTGTIIVIMQRLHESDLAAHCLAEGYAHLCLPMRYDPARPDPRDRRRERGELLDARRFPAEVVAGLERALGARQAAAQLDQDPIPDAGGLFQRAWFRHRFKTPPAAANILMSVDATFRDTETSDYVVIQVWAWKGVDRWLIDQRRERLAYTATRQLLKDLAARHRPSVVLIEAKANGDALINELRTMIPGVVAFEPGTRSKYERAQVGSAPAAEAGQIWLPEDAPFVDIFVEEHVAFPRAAHDDTVDACSQAMLYLAQGPGDVVERAQARLGLVRGFAR